MDPESYHSHLRKVKQPIIGEVWRALLNKAEIGEVHAQVRNEWRIAAMQGLTHRPESPQIAGQVLQLVDYVLLLKERFVRVELEFSWLSLKFFHSFAIDASIATPWSSKLTDFVSFSQVRFNRNTLEFVNAEQIWSTPLKLCRHLD